MGRKGGDRHVTGIDQRGVVLHLGQGGVGNDVQGQRRADPEAAARELRGIVDVMLAKRGT